MSLNRHLTHPFSQTFSYSLSRLIHQFSTKKSLPLTPKFSFTPPFMQTVRYFSNAPTINASIKNEPTIAEMVNKLTPGQKKCLQRLRTGGMSFGSISLEAHTAIASGVNQMAMALHNVSTMEELKKLPYFVGPMSNSGEGGELESRNNTILQSFSRQVASGRFGVNIQYLANAIELQIKINQGAKPGIGGELPGPKVNELIAKTRLTKPGVTLASPPPHHDIYSIEDLKQLVRDLVSANPQAKVSIKLAASVGIGVIAAGVVKCGATNISIAGPGGTGAAPLTAKYEFVHPWETSLAEVHQTLTANGLRTSTTLTVSGGIQTGLDYFKALLLGADYIETGSSVLVSLGCIMAEVCHGKDKQDPNRKRDCPKGLATTNQEVIKSSFTGKPEDVARFMIACAKSLNTYLEKYGFTDPSQSVGRVDLLRVKKNSPLTGLEKLLFNPVNPYYAFGKLKPAEGSSYTEEAVIADIQKGNTSFELKSSNSDLSFGARIAYLTTQTSHSTLFTQPLTFRFKGLAVAQSFGFLAPPNTKFIAENSNDGTGKSLDGAEIYIKYCTGNQAAFGATRGKFFTQFMGDRGAVRNSGADIITLQLGQMGANFMTGGSLTILGTPKHYPVLTFTHAHKPPILFRKDTVGPNLGAGFSGGKIVMPKQLYAELENSHYLAPQAQKLQPQKLSATDVDELSENLQKFTQEIPNPWVKELLEQKNKFGEEFIKLDPTFVKKQVQTSILVTRKNPNSDNKKIVSTNQQHKKMLPKKILAKKLATSPKQEPLATKSSSEEKDACGTGLLVRRDGSSSKDLTQRVLTMLARFMHRGSVGIDPKTGDGCGIAWYGLDVFFQKQFSNHILLKNQYSVIPINLSNDNSDLEKTDAIFNQCLSQENLTVADQRHVPTNPELLGYIGRQQEITIKHFLILKPESQSIPEFEKSLIRTRLRFEMRVQQETFKVRPHIYSASAYHVIYKSLVKEDEFARYFLDFSDPLFQTSAGVSHSRFATNTLPNIKNIQPLAKVANNGENNALEMITRLLTLDPTLSELLGITTVNLAGFSDSHIMSIYMDMLHLLDFSAEEVVASTIQPYHPIDNLSSQYYNLFAVPFEGPNASIIMMNNKITIVRDINGFRPQRGIINDNYIYSGSELGTVDIEGDIFDLPPGQPLLINLENGSASLIEQQAEHYEHQQTQFGILKQIPATIETKDFLHFTQDELELRKLRAGWDDEVNHSIMEPLFTGVGSINSMGDQSPIEALVKGSFLSLRNYFKGNFSQVTNPALAKKEEEAYMSTLTFVGKKPALVELNKFHTEGYTLNSPIVNNDEMAYLLADENLEAKVIDITFIEYTRESGLKEAIERVRKECVQNVIDGASLLVLSDLKSNSKYIAIDPILIASIVHQELLARGLRREVSLALQEASLLSGRDIAQAITIGGVDIINPYLAFIPSKTQYQTPIEFKKRCETYKENLRQELLSFMARMGISTVTAYRGTKGFNAYGLDSDVAAMFGVPSVLGGLSLQGLIQISRNKHNLPKKEGLGKYHWQGPGHEARTKIWNPTTINPAINTAKGNESEFKEMEDNANRLKTGAPRGWLSLVEPQVWTHENPMTVCIMGGGAAGFYQARALLDSSLPVKIVIIERRHVNKFGLVGDGIAPDHSSTKNQANWLKECLNDNRVKYFGGIEVGQHVTFEELKQTYPCIIDCRGAENDKALGVAGEKTIPGIVYASEVYGSYNNEYSPLRDPSNLPLKVESKNPAIGIIGNGNVTADLARIFLKNPDELAETNINPHFLSYLREEGPQIVRIFARGNPTQCKIDLKGLLELEKMGIWISSSFDPFPVEADKLTQEQKAIYDFFAKYNNRQSPLTGVKRLYFHFQLNIQRFNSVGTDIEAEFDKDKTFRAKNYIIAIGKEQRSRLESTYVSGWARGEGGTLNSAEKSAYETTQKIVNDFRNRCFPNLSEQAKETWQLNSSVGKREFLNILAYLQSGKILNTIDDFILAKQYQPIMVNETSTSNVIEAPKTHTIQPDMNCITIIDENGKANKLPSNSTGTLLSLFKTHLPTSVPKHECDGSLVCGQCAVKLGTESSTLKPGPKESVLLKNNKFNPKNHILACAHHAENLKGLVFTK